MPTIPLFDSQDVADPVVSSGDPNQAPLGGQSALSTTDELLGAVEDELQRDFADECEPDLTDDDAQQDSEIFDRRALPRRFGDCKLVAHAFDGDFSICDHNWMLHASKLSGPLVNLSLTSVAFELNRGLPVGSQLLLRITNARTGGRVEALGRVERVSSIRGTHIVVCTLTQPMHYVELDNLGWTPTDTEFV